MGEITHPKGVVTPLVGRAAKAQGGPKKQQQLNSQMKGPTMTYHSFEAAGTQTAVPPTGFGMPPNGTATILPPSGTGYWGSPGHMTPPANTNTGNKPYWIVIVGVVAVALAAAIVAVFALKSGSSPQPSPVAAKPTSSGSGSSPQSTSSQQPASSTASQGTPSQQPTQSQTSSSPQSANSSAAVSQYLNDVDGQGGDFLYVSDSDLLTYGEAVCGDFQAGNTVQQTVDDAVNAADSNQEGLTQSDLGVIVGAATSTLCPSYGPEVQAWAQANG